jgi:hypothetical protein
MITEAENSINNFLQKEVTFFIHPDKPIKVGRLLVFRFKDFYFNFVIKTSSGNKIFEIPYPFNIESHQDHIKFSYTLEDFSQKNLDLFLKAKVLIPKKRNKLYNSVVVLSALN